MWPGLELMRGAARRAGRVCRPVNRASRNQYSCSPRAARCCRRSLEPVAMDTVPDKPTGWDPAALAPADTRRASLPRAPQATATLPSTARATHSRTPR